MGLASIQIKQDEPGLLAAAEELGLPIRFYPPNQLERVEGIENPSAVVAKHLGVSSVCEAAAILAANRGNLIVPKRATPNVTVAIARIAFTS
jgi:cobalt-precorrin 5A hydrolase